MTHGQFLLLYLYCGWAAHMGMEQHKRKQNRGALIPSTGDYFIYDSKPSPERSACGERWQFCDEWRVDGPDGRKIERRVI